MAVSNQSVKSDVNERYESFIVEFRISTSIGNDGMLSLKIDISSVLTYIIKFSSITG